MESEDRILSYSKTSELPLDSTIIRLFTSLDDLIGYGTSDLEDLWVLLNMKECSMILESAKFKSTIKNPSI